MDLPQHGVDLLELYVVVAPIMIGYAIGLSRTVHRSVDSLDSAHARTSNDADNGGERS